MIKLVPNLNICQKAFLCCDGAQAESTIKSVKLELVEEEYPVCDKLIR